jgi:uncharacterized protein YaiL (DUF2058 family)
MHEEREVIVLGAGFAGLFTTKELLTRGWKVTLIDAFGILNNKSSSYNQSYRMHLGAHYSNNLHTAIRCLHTAIVFVRKYPCILLGSDNPSVPWRRGRYFAIPNSDSDIERIKNFCTQLQLEYERLVKKDPANKVFGEPEDFIKYLEKNDYTYIADPIQIHENDAEIQKAVLLGIETPESQVNLPLLKKQLKGELKQYQEKGKLKQLLEHTVIDISAQQNSFNYTVIVKDLQGNLIYLTTPSLVNCTWQNIEKLDKKVKGWTDNQCLLRLKASLVIDLPENLKEINTCIFIEGPHCSLTNLGDGTAVLTYEPVTNVGYYSAGTQLKTNIISETELSDEFNEDNKIAALTSSAQRIKYFLLKGKCSTQAISGENKILCENNNSNINTIEQSLDISFKNNNQEPHPILYQELRQLTKILSPDEGIGKILADKILLGATCYIPKLQEAKAREVRLGYVKIIIHPGQFYSLVPASKNNAIHQRLEEGVIIQDLGRLSNSSMKMTYAVNNANKIAECLEIHAIVRRRIEFLIKSILKTLKINRAPKMVKKNLLYHIHREYLISMIKLNKLNIFYPILLEDEEFKQISNYFKNILEIREGINANGLIKIKEGLIKTEKYSLYSKTSFFSKSLDFKGHYLESRNISRTSHVEKLSKR